jgi:signal transduction histidine kinase
MNHGMLFRVTAPAVAVGLLLLAVCFAGVYYTQRIQRDLANILSQNVASLQAAEELEISVRQLRFHDVLYLMDPTPDRLPPIEEDQRRFYAALAVARDASRTAEEQKRVQAIEDGYQGYLRYRKEQDHIGEAPGRDFDRRQFARQVDAHAVKRFIVEPCQELLRVNKAEMERTVADNRLFGSRIRWAMALLGLTGPVGGLVLGYGVARGLRRSIYRLSVGVRDMAHHLDRDVASVSVAADGDLGALDRQLQYIVGRVEEVAARLQEQQRELLRAEQLAAVGQLAAGIAHEVRNPLTGIKLLVEAALRPVNPTPLNGEDLRVIHGEIDRLEQTVQGFLDFARLPAPRRQPCDLREVVGRARDLGRVRAEQQHVAVTLSAPAEPVSANVDPGQISTVLVNLILNALDAMPQGGTLAIELADAPGGPTRMTVTDTGPGISPAVADRLFTPFVTTRPTGTGLGLSLSRRIIEEHGGTIAAENRPEGGARFRITLPPPPTEVARADALGDR